METVKGDSATILIFLSLLILLELHPLVALFTEPDRASMLMQHRFTIWLLALVWHGLTILMVFALLKLKHLKSRFRNTLAAYFGVFVLFQVAGVLLQLLGRDALPPIIRTLLVLVWLSWSCLAFGYLFGSALSIKFYRGVLVAFLVNFASYVLVFVVIGSIVSPELLDLFLQ